MEGQRAGMLMGGWWGLVRAVGMLLGWGLEGRGRGVIGVY